MSTIIATPKFQVGESVWPKAILDPYLDTAAPMDAVCSFNVQKMLYKVETIYVKVDANGAAIYYGLSLASPDTSNLPTAMEEQPVLSNLLESSIYSLSEGIDLIMGSDSKIQDFEEYLMSLS